MATLATAAHNMSRQDGPATRRCRPQGCSKVRFWHPLRVRGFAFPGVVLSRDPRLRCGIQIEIGIAIEIEGTPKSIPIPIAIAIWMKASPNQRRSAAEYDAAGTIWRPFGAARVNADAIFEQPWTQDGTGRRRKRHEEDYPLHLD